MCKNICGSRSFKQQFRVETIIRSFTPGNVGKKFFYLFTEQKVYWNLYIFRNQSHELMKTELPFSYVEKGITTNFKVNPLMQKEKSLQLI